MLFEKRGLEIEMEKVNKHIQRLLRSDNAKMQEVMDWILQEKGKQLRPKLVLLSSKFGKSSNDATEYAAILEIVHMASLVHDDVIDEADTRRGKLSVQKKFGKNMAVYAGDYMIFAAFGSGNLKYNDNFRKLYKTMNQICYGELGQNEWLYNMDISVEEYIRNITGKTASMFQLACEIGGIIGEADKNTAKNLADYGKNLGILFQIQDDLLDYRSAEKTIGKPIYQDFANGIYTLPILFALEDNKLKKRLLDIKSQISGKYITQEQCEQLTDIIQAANGFEKCYEKSKEYYICANKALENLPEREEKEYMQMLIDTIYQNI